jgi:hypothetical protein
MEEVPAGTPIGGGVDLIALLGERLGEKAAQGNIIIDDEDRPLALIPGDPVG